MIFKKKAREMGSYDVIRNTPAGIQFEKRKVRKLIHSGKY